MQTLMQDIRYALRQFGLSPVFTLTAMLTLALGIGATTAIFSLVNAVMLRSLPVAQPESLYRIGDSVDCCVEGGPQDNWGLFSDALSRRLTAAAPEFEQVAVFEAMPAQFSVRRQAANSTSASMAKPLRGEFISGNYFQVFGVSAFAGRTITPADDLASAAPVAMLSYRIWREAYGSDPTVLGSTFVVGGRPFTVVGISAPGFFGETLRSDPPEIWMPLQQEALVQGPGSLLRQPNVAWLRLIGRLRPGAKIDGVAARLTGVLREWLTAESGYPADFLPQVIRTLPKQHINVVAGGSGVSDMKTDYGNSLRLLLTVCGLVLLIACANIANLLIARGMARKSHTSLRMALGASRQRIIRQSLTESLLLSIFGGVLGIGVAYAGENLMLQLAFPSARVVPIDTSPSLLVLGFTLILSLATGVLFGTAPAWFTSQSDPVEALRGANRSTRDHTSLPQRALLVLQATLSVVLLAGAALLTHSLANLEQQDLGFLTDHRVSIDIDQPLAGYSRDRLESLYREMEGRLAQIPGVERASLALYSPFVDNWGEMVWVQGHAAPRFEEDSGSSWDRVSPGYLETMGQTMLRGRTISRTDTAQSRPVAVVNQAFVQRFFKQEDPLGKHFGIDLPAYASAYEIVGVVRDAKYVNPAKPVRPMFFVPLAQYIEYKEDMMKLTETRSHYLGSVVLLVRGSLGTIEPRIRAELSQVNPDLSIVKIQTMEQQVAADLDRQRAVARLTGVFGVLALILAAVGLYGVTAYTVARRTSEIGVRMALGADKANVVRLVLRGAYVQIALGLVIGIPIAIGAGRLLSSELYQVSSWDPIAMGVAVVSLGVCGLVATIIPARRAASIDPMRALRTE